jgi:hypothetical protein
MDGHISVKSSFSVLCLLRGVSLCALAFGEHNTRDWKMNSKKKSLEHTQQANVRGKFSMHKRRLIRKKR